MMRRRRLFAWTLPPACALIVAAAIYLPHLALRHRGSNATADSAEGSPGLRDVTLLIANDADGSLTPRPTRCRSTPHPDMQAQDLLDALFAAYASPQSAHPLSSLAAIRDVHLTPLPGGFVTSRAASQLATVNLSSEFVASHPSGIESETLTLLSVIATLHANQPSIAQVRFLVDGHKRDTLAGHADLTHVYLASAPE